MVIGGIEKSRKRDGSAGYLGEEVCTLLSMRIGIRVGDFMW